MKIIAILAMDTSRLIGADNGLPWHIPEDLQRFKEFTMGHIVVMGRNTYFSLPEKVRPLPNRRNIVITREPIDGIETYSSIEQFIAQMQPQVEQKIYLIGGASLYNQFFAHGYVDQVELTLLDGEHDGDIYVDEFREGFNVVSLERFSQGIFQTLIKKS